MKTKFALTSLVILGGLAAFATPAAAHTDIRVNFGYCAPAPVVYVPARAPVYVERYAPPAPAYYVQPVVQPSGYWKEVVVKSWVPERCFTSYDRWSRPVRVVEPGHFALRTERVWVNACR